ncbi:MAG: right-handed parallel beta-helix repeat-containing protein [Acidobacteria bacterium]|nr:right-handed parallel beta-helix repeat-containing protein [Acidobacteriota bacterium]
MGRLLAFLITFPVAAEVITVSSDGPISTLAAARDAVRQIKRAGAGGPITVQIRGGRYLLSEPLVLAPEDSGAAGQPIVWQAAPGERVLISGGRVLSGWRKGSGALWQADAGTKPFRQLFVSGRRAQRARTPNFGFYRIDGPSSQDKPFRLKFRGDDIRKEWAGTDTEVIALLAWADVRMPIVAVDEVEHTAVLGSDPRPSNRERDARYYIENAPDALDAAGEWRLDQASNTVHYWPLAGEDMGKEEFIAPQLPQLVRLEGRPEAGQFVRDIVFRNLEFAHTDWTMDPKGYADTQAAMAVGAAFEATGAENITIEKCQFRHLGNYAIWLARGARNNRMVRNEIFDIGAGGIRLGETVQRQNEAERNRDNEVTDNHIHHLGYVYPPAVGVFIAQSSRNHVAHNHIHDLYYTAISAGWTWGYGANQSKENLIEYNHLHHIGLEMLSDMGGIYTLGMQPGTVLRNNLIHDIASFTYGGWGIYPDEGSSHMLIENNVVYRCASAGFHQHYGMENIVRNNVFAFNRDYQLMRTRAEAHLSFSFESNIVVYDRGRLLGSNWTGDQFRMDRNIYYDLRGGPIRLAGKTWQEWQASGQDEHSLIADPLFVNSGAFDFRLREDSPALKLGFQPIDLSRVGPRPE